MRKKCSTFLKSEQPRLKADLERAEAALTEYQSQSGSINASDEAKVYLEGSMHYEAQIAAFTSADGAVEPALWRRPSGAHRRAASSWPNWKRNARKYSDRFRICRPPK